MYVEGQLLIGQNPTKSSATGTYNHREASPPPRLTPPPLCCWKINNNFSTLPLVKLEEPNQNSASNITCPSGIMSDQVQYSTDKASFKFRTY